jgi:hypothetical protein
LPEPDISSRQIRESIMQQRRACAFEYTRSDRTDIRRTFERFGFRPTTDAERLARQSASASAGAVARSSCLADTVHPGV